MGGNTLPMLFTGYPLHMENSENGHTKIPVRENTGNLEKQAFLCDYFQNSLLLKINDIANLP